jgi:hypothetical protein
MQETSIVIPHDRYRDLLEKEERLISEEKLLAINIHINNWDVQSYKLYNGDESTIKMMKELQKSGNRIYTLEDRLDDIKRQHETLKTKYEILTKKTNLVKTKWWYKFFVLWYESPEKTYL